MPQLSDDASLLPPAENAGPWSGVVFFDGVCGLCNASVDFILRRDTRQRFRFAPLQGETARQAVPREDIDRLDTLVLLSPSGITRRSAAVVHILWQLPGIWPWVGAVLWLVPLPLRDAGYRFVSARRLRWFGQKESCRLPTEAERERFWP